MRWMAAVVLMVTVGCCGTVQANEAESLFQEAVQAAQADNYDTALAKFEAALQADPNNLRYGNAYRLTVVKINQAKTYDRCIAFFQKLVADHPKAANAFLNFGYAYVDKIPVEGAITQVLLANKALGQFSAALALEESWLGLYTRGNSYIYWPAIFGRTPLAIADLEKAIALSKQTAKRSYHARAYVALGEAYWRLSDLKKARQIWQEALPLFPANEALQVRLQQDDKGLQALLTAHFEQGKRVDTNISGIWEEDEAPAVAKLKFEEIGARAGVRFVHSTRKFTGKHKAQVLQMFTDGGAAVAVGDFNNDGFDDLFVTDSDTGKPNHLMRNNGDMTFTDVAQVAGVAGGNDAQSVVSDALWFDYNNDGLPDLLVARFGTPILYRNDGPGPDGNYRFTDVSADVGLTKFGNTVAVIAFDIDNDGWLDLMFGNYFQSVNLLDLQTPHVLPNNLDYADNGGGVTLWHNVPLANGERGFVEITEAAGFARHTGWTLDLGHGDFNNDGCQDVYLAVDYGTDRLFFNKCDGTGTFVEVTETAIGYDTRKGMNVDIGDYDRDGWLDIYVTNITDEYMKECNMLWHNNGDGTFTDLSKETGTCDTGWGWAAKFADFDNDGWEDLFAVNGLRSAGEQNYIPVLMEMLLKPGVDFSDVNNYPDIGNMTWSGYQKKRLFRNMGDGTFKEVGAEAGVDTTLDGRGIGVGDFNNDGLLDFYQTNANQPALLFRGCTDNPGNWVELKLIGTKSNRDAIGTRVVLTAGGQSYLREVNGGNGYSSQSTTRLHFGVGSASSVEHVEIRWPSGLVQTLSPEQTATLINRLTYIREGEGVVQLNKLTSIREGVGQR
jgi:tetratricopeptide (TPR) repeat protein